MNVTFWGVRGSVAVSGARFQATGGNTSCVTVAHEGHLLVLDAGTGLGALAEHLGAGPQRLTFLFSHVHWDHIQGFPFFGPAFHPASVLELIGARRGSGGLEDALRRQMKPPQFPITLDHLRARLAFHDAAPEQILEVGPFRLRARDLCHPDGVFAWRVEAGGHSLVYATDVEHERGLDRRLISLSEGVDLLIHDAQYTDAEVEGRCGPSRRGWGHSSWEQAVGCAEAAEVRRLALFHHDPRRCDRGVAEVERQALSRLSSALAAREGLELAL
jgi:phosphoribosyl 1,2-cyclic phosphodiesterase